MSNERIRTYEGMFLFPQSATANLQEAADHVKAILDECGATVLTFRKWDDRRLAYEVQGNKRGVYFLAYFTAPTTALAEIERRCNLSEELLRMMITSAEHIPSEIIEANDGQEDLAAEIKLRSEKSTETSSKSMSKISSKSEKVVEKAETPEPEIVEEVVENSKDDSSEPTKEVSTEA
jgi:small subunit ribosomal protein S6